jgi:hypothetical protein
VLERRSARPLSTTQFRHRVPPQVVARGPLPRDRRGAISNSLKNIKATEIVNECTCRAKPTQSRSRG